MLLLFVGTALLVGLFGGFVIGVRLMKDNYEKQMNDKSKEQPNTMEDKAD